MLISDANVPLFAVRDLAMPVFIEDIIDPVPHCNSNEKTAIHSVMDNENDEQNYKKQISIKQE